MIKLRGDACWRDLTCLRYHYETQPLPNPLSWLLHQAPNWFHALEALGNHAVELVVPFLLFGPRRLRHVGGAITIAFQIWLIFSGNLSFLNYLTIAIAVACFDDSLLARLLPRRLASAPAPSPRRRRALTPARRVVSGALVALIGGLSVAPVANLLSNRQAMNASFDPLDLVNTYGAFGTVGRSRDEIVLAGTDAAVPDA